MKLDLGKGGNGKQSPVLVIVLIVAILGAGGMFAKNFIGGGGGSDSSELSTSMPDANSAMPSPGMEASIPPATGTTVPASSSAPPPATGAASAPSTPPPAAAQSSAVPAPTPVGKDGTRSIKVFNTVNVTYPANWRISASAANTAAVFTDGKASFEVHAPDPKANSAIAIAQSALKTLASGGKVTNQGKDSIAGHEAYWYAVNRGGRTVRIVGVDAPTRIVLVEQVNSSQFSAYRDMFNKMQSGISF